MASTYYAPASTAKPPGYLQAGTVNHPAKLFRRMLAGLIGAGHLAQNNEAASGALSGLTGPFDFRVVQSGTPGMSVQVRKGYAVVPNGGTDLGNYFVFNDAPVSAIAVPAADPTNARKDLVVLRVRDTVDNSPADSADDWVIEYISGTASASPADPAIPNPQSVLLLARVNVAAAAASIANAAIDDLRVRAQPTFGGRIPANNVITTAQTTASTSYTDLATVGPTVTIVGPPSGMAIVTLRAGLSNATDAADNFMGVQVSPSAGITPSIAAASDDYAVSSRQVGSGTQALPRTGASILVTGMTPGTSYTFTAKYRATAGTMTARSREMIVIPV